MAKTRSDSKLAVAGALTLALAIAGVLLVKEPLRSSRPAGSALELKPGSSEQIVRARLWEDPVAAVERAIRRSGSKPSSGAEASLARRLMPLRKALAERVENGQRVTVLLVTTSGGPYVDNIESRIRDRYAVGTALGVGCYAPEGEGYLSFVDWEPGGAMPGLPYEWYRLRKTRVCGADEARADSVLVVWFADEALRRGFLATLTSFSQALVCEDSAQGECLLTQQSPKLVRIRLALQRAVTVKIMGPRSSSAFRAILDEVGQLYGRPHDGVGVWPNADGTVELYSPWASAMRGLLAYGLKTESGRGAACRTYEDCEHEFHRRLADANIRLVYEIGSDDLLFEGLIAELERRQVKLGWDAVILIGEWDSFTAGPFRSSSAPPPASRWPRFLSSNSKRFSFRSRSRRAVPRSLAPSISRFNARPTMKISGSTCFATVTSAVWTEKCRATMRPAPLGRRGRAPIHRKTRSGIDPKERASSITCER